MWTLRYQSLSSQTQGWGDVGLMGWKDGGRREDIDSTILTICHINIGKSGAAVRPVIGGDLYLSGLGPACWDSDTEPQQSQISALL